MVHNITHCLEKGKSRRETLAYASPLYINGDTVGNYNFETKTQKYSHTYKYTHINIYTHV